jgi:hypothetical protein
VAGLHATVQLLHSAQVSARDRDAILVGLLERAQDGDRLAGRVVLQTMLPAAVRLARAITSRPDVLGDSDEAFALVLAALWQVVATYPVARRRSKVPANLYLDTLALVRRGHTSSTHRAARTFPEQSYADIRTVAEPGRLDPAPTTRPARPTRSCAPCWPGRCARRSCAWTRRGLLARVYGLDGGLPTRGLRWPPSSACPGRHCASAAIAWPGGSARRRSPPGSTVRTSRVRCCARPDPR